MNDDYNAKPVAEDVVNDSSPLYLPIDDVELKSIIDQKIKDYDEFVKNSKIDERQKENLKYYKGDQIDKSQLHKFQVPYVDNIIWQNLETRISLASARLPDIVGIPVDDTPEANDLAKKVKEAIELKVKNKNIKRLIKDGLRTHQINHTGIIKIRWDANRGDNGDFVFDHVQPSNVKFDVHAPIPHDGYTSDNMEVIIEYIEEPTNLVLSKFPKKREELLKIIGVTNKGLPASSKIKYSEIWFTWYDKQGKRFEGVAWRYKDLILDKMRNPYYDWKGKELQLDADLITTGLRPGVEYQNYFEFARKPYIFFSHQNLGVNAFDEMTPVSASIALQDIINKRGRQITEISDRAVPKLVFSGNYITKDRAKQVTNDPNESVWLDEAERVGDAVMSVPGTPPNPILYNDLVTTRNQMDSKFATHGTTRGEVQATESGISKQITREGDLGITDDVVDMMVERVMSEMAGWALQMMKMMYNENRYIKDMGKDGKLVAVELSGSDIPKGLEIQVRADSSDEQRKKAEAIELAKLKAIDPLTMNEMLDVPNPKESTDRLLSFLNGAADGYASYMEKVGLLDKGEGGQGGEVPPAAPGATPPEGGAIPPEGMPNMPAAEPQQNSEDLAYQDIQKLMAGQNVQPSGQVDEQYVGVFVQFVNSPAFDNLDPEIQRNFAAYINNLKNLVA